MAWSDSVPGTTCCTAIPCVHPRQVSSRQIYGYHNIMLGHLVDLYDGGAQLHRPVDSASVLGTVRSWCCTCLHRFDADVVETT